MSWSLLESIGSIESPHHTPRQLAIPATLQEALLARLDRLSAARQIAQLGATLGESSRMNCCTQLRHSAKPICKLPSPNWWKPRFSINAGWGASTLLLQACADPRHGLSIAAQEHPAAVSPADCPGVGRTISRDQRDPA